MTGDHNEKPVWSRHDGTQKMFYDNGKFLFTEMTFITNIDMTGGRWNIGPDPTRDGGGVRTAEVSLELPHQTSEWQFWDGHRWQTDPLLNVTGNVIILRSLILTISTTVEGAPPEYPEIITIKDETGENSDLAGVYRRQGTGRVWKYGDFELSFNGI